MRRGTAIAAAVGIGLALAYAALERGTTVSSRPEDAAPVTPPLADEAGARTAASGPQPAPFVAEARRPEDGPPPEAAPPTTGATAAPGTTGDTDARAEPQPEVLGEHDDDFANNWLQVAERFRREARDPTAAVSLEHEILARFAALPGLEATTLDIECRTTTCRVRITERPGAELRPLVGPGGGFEKVVEGFWTVSTASEAADGSTVFEWLLARDPPAPK